MVAAFIHRGTVRGAPYRPTNLASSEWTCPAVITRPNHLAGGLPGWCTTLAYTTRPSITKRSALARRGRISCGRAPRSVVAACTTGTSATTSHVDGDVRFEVTRMASSIWPVWRCGRADSRKSRSRSTARRWAMNPARDSTALRKLVTSATTEGYVVNRPGLWRPLPDATACSQPRCASTISVNSPHASAASTHFSWSRHAPLSGA